MLRKSIEIVLAGEYVRTCEHMLSECGVREYARYYTADQALDEWNRHVDGSPMTAQMWHIVHSSQI